MATSYAQQIQVSDPGYLHYVAGVHSTAGPLPSPPRTIVPPTNGAAPPPRPPRLQSPPPGARRKRDEPPAPQSIASSLMALASTLPLQPPPSRSPSRPQSLSGSSTKVPRSVTNSLVSTPEIAPVPLPSHSATDSEDERTPRKTKHHHIREGGGLQSDSTVQSKCRRKHGEEIVRRKAPKLPWRRSLSLLLAIRLMTQAPQPQVARPGPPPIGARNWPNLPYRDNRAGSANKVRHQAIGITTRNHTRLPPNEASSTRSQHSGTAARTQEVRRTPSSLSVSRASARSSIMSPSTLHAAAEDVAKPTRLLNPWPSAMQFTDVLSLRTTLERTKAYSRKLKELSQCRCGLEDWMRSERDRSTPDLFLSLLPTDLCPETQRHASVSTFELPASPSTSSFSGQLRKRSHGSIASEVTFPMRPDAYVATDLTSKSDDAESVNTQPNEYAISVLSQGAFSGRTELSHNK